ncbi:hypothetical protein EVB81_218 [Rhizobium phage RHph_I46]|uniref:Uncharacterized protein n=1 Tax=Rhizobium phage RHph_I1_9 TaxID=2509729 RepID=A0A7S5UXR4_9CAUD|nr:hypothetical protein PP936_gp216 [Rhizobium phage RHph_I1_9]QIG69787.1 hypothetical protein EVB81_218 [Rhizobium phage RHph_I46]QIG71068.1 hypothetical protein EVB92_218 [Rhizobium phage RHph_I9]QIG73653.1 hypothetical protein EVC04_216 [Rhizobium phage RHph_I1_9]QIG76407.1 hypothetical protein EVC25_218 [Rhizobium phage RHph_I34]
MALTDKKAIRMALHIAIDSENAIIDAYSGRIDEPAVINAKRHIAAFRRVLKRYFPSQQKTPLDQMIDDGLKDGSIQYVNIYDLLKGKTLDRGDE